MIPCQKAAFDLPQDIAYFNAAYFPPNLVSVRAAGESAIRRTSTPWTIKFGDFVDGPEPLRGLFAQLIGATADDIAIIPATSYGIATAAANLNVGRGRKIVVLQNQYPNNVMPWIEKSRKVGAKMVAVPQPRDGEWTSAVLAAIDGQTDVVSLPNCHWCDGTLLDLVAIGKRCREVGAALVVDLTQSAGALPFDVNTVAPDFLVAAGYKWLLGPYSLGYLYVAPHRRNGIPLEVNWTARKDCHLGHDWRDGILHYREGWREGARRFDVGEHANFMLVPMAEEGLRYILKWGVGRIHTTISEITKEIAVRSAHLGLIAPPENSRSGHFIGIHMPNGVPDNFLSRLEASNIFVSMKGNTIRISPHLWNDEADIDKLIGAIKENMEFKA